jgi:hypothetical protein
MAIVVPPLDDLCDQINDIAPNRDKASDGAQGNKEHQSRPSSHNGDRSGTPEHRDGDAKDEIRARDFDKDLREPGLTMLMIVRHLVLGARSGRFWWIRYIIFDGLIYHKSTGFQARVYTGANKHDKHAHVNNDFTQAADNVRGVNYHLEEIPVALTNADKVWIAGQITAARDAVLKDASGRTDDFLDAKIGDAANPNRKVRDVLKDFAKLRGWLVGDAKDTANAAIPASAPVALALTLLTTVSNKLTALNSKTNA